MTGDHCTHRAPSCVCLRRAAAGRCRPRVSSRPTPVLYGICVARFCASLEAAQASRVTIAARTRHATASTPTGESLTQRCARQRFVDRSQIYERRHSLSLGGETQLAGTSVTDSTLSHTRHTDGKGGAAAATAAAVRGRSSDCLGGRCSVPERAVCAGSRVRPGGKAQASPWWRRRETRRWPAVAETRAFRTPRSGR